MPWTNCVIGFVLKLKTVGRGNWNDFKIKASVTASKNIMNGARDICTSSFERSLLDK